MSTHRRIAAPKNVSALPATAALATVINWRLLFVFMAVVVAGSAVWMLTRRDEQPAAATPATMEA